jgi:predicted RNase H-like HicB family nuclease
LSEYVVVTEQEGASWGAYCPDLPGLGVVGESRAEVEELIGEAIQLHLAVLRESGESVPEPSAIGTTTVPPPAD